MIQKNIAETKDYSLNETATFDNYILISNNNQNIDQKSFRIRVVDAQPNNNTKNISVMSNGNIFRSNLLNYFNWSDNISNDEMIIKASYTNNGITNTKTIDNNVTYFPITDLISSNVSSATIVLSSYMQYNDNNLYIASTNISVDINDITINWKFDSNVNIFIPAKSSNNYIDLKNALIESINTYNVVGSLELSSNIILPKNLYISDSVLYGNMSNEISGEILSSYVNLNVPINATYNEQNEITTNIDTFNNLYLTIVDAQINDTSEFNIFHIIQPTNLSEFENEFVDLQHNYITWINIPSGNQIINNINAIQSASSIIVNYNICCSDDINTNIFIKSAQKEYVVWPQLNWNNISPIYVKYDTNIDFTKECFVQPFNWPATDENWLQQIQISENSEFTTNYTINMNTQLSSDINTIAIPKNESNTGIYDLILNGVISRTDSNNTLYNLNLTSNPVEIIVCNGIINPISSNIITRFGQIQNFQLSSFCTIDIQPSSIINNIDINFNVPNTNWNINKQILNDINSYNLNINLPNSLNALNETFSFNININDIELNSLTFNVINYGIPYFVQNLLTEKTIMIKNNEQIPNTNLFKINNTSNINIPINQNINIDLSIYGITQYDVEINNEFSNNLIDQMLLSEIANNIPGLYISNNHILGKITNTAFIKQISNNYEIQLTGYTNKIIITYEESNIEINVNQNIDIDLLTYGIICKNSSVNNNSIDELVSETSLENISNIIPGLYILNNHICGIITDSNYLTTLKYNNNIHEILVNDYKFQIIVYFTEKTVSSDINVFINKNNNIDLSIYGISHENIDVNNNYENEELITEMTLDELSTNIPGLYIKNNYLRGKINNNTYLTQIDKKCIITLTDVNKKIYINFITNNTLEIETNNDIDIDLTIYGIKQENVSASLLDYEYKPLPTSFYLNQISEKVPGLYIENNCICGKITDINFNQELQIYNELYNEYKIQLTDLNNQIYIFNNSNEGDEINLSIEENLYIDLPLYGISGITNIPSAIYNQTELKYDMTVAEIPIYIPGTYIDEDGILAGIINNVSFINRVKTLNKPYQIKLTDQNNKILHTYFSNSNINIPINEDLNIDLSSYNININDQTKVTSYSDTLNNIIDVNNLCAKIPGIYINDNHILGKITNTTFINQIQQVNSQYEFFIRSDANTTINNKFIIYQQHIIDFQLLTNTDINIDLLTYGIIQNNVTVKNNYENNSLTTSMLLSEIANNIPGLYISNNHILGKITNSKFINQIKEYNSSYEIQITDLNNKIIISSEQNNIINININELNNIDLADFGIFYNDYVEINDNYENTSLTTSMLLSEIANNIPGLYIENNHILGKINNITFIKQIKDYDDSYNIQITDYNKIINIKFISTNINILINEDLDIDLLNYGIISDNVEVNNSYENNNLNTKMELKEIANNIPGIYIKDNHILGKITDWTFISQVDLYNTIYEVELSDYANTLIIYFNSLYVKPNNIIDETYNISSNLNIDGLIITNNGILSGTPNISEIDNSVQLIMNINDNTNNVLGTVNDITLQVFDYQIDSSKNICPDIKYRAEYDNIQYYESNWSNDIDFYNIVLNDANTTLNLTTDNMYIKLKSLDDLLTITDNNLYATSYGAYQSEINIYANNYIIGQKLLLNTSICVIPILPSNFNILSSNILYDYFEKIDTTNDVLLTSTDYMLDSSLIPTIIYKSENILLNNNSTIILAGSTGIICFDNHVILYCE